MSRIVAGIVLVVTLLTAACSSAGTTPAASTKSDIVPAEVAARTLAMPHRYEVFLELPDGNQDIDPDRPVQLGSFDGEWLAVDSMLGPFQALGGTEPTMQSITGGDVGYFFLPGWQSLDGGTLDAFLRDNPLGPAANSWVVMDIGEIQDRVGLDDPLTLTPNIADVTTDLEDILAQVIDIREGPPSTHRGVETQTFEGIIPSDPDDPIFGPQEDIEVLFELDSDGYLRSMTSGDPRFGRSRIDIFNIGVVPAIELPTGAVDITESTIVSLYRQRSVDLGFPPGDSRPMTDEEIAEIEELLAEHENAGPEAEVDTPPAAQESLLELIAFQPELSLFLELLQSVDLDDVLDDPLNSLTVIAPTNSALQWMGNGLTVLQDDPAALTDFLYDHIVVRRYSAAELDVGAEIMTLGGDMLTAGRRDMRLNFGPDSGVLVGDKHGTNGVLYIVDRPIG